VRLGARFVHYSTDYVFDGAGDRPYREEDPTAPLNAYGASKRAGEERVLAAGGRALVLRTSWVYGAEGRNFLNTMLRRAGPDTASPDALRVVDDQHGAPTATRFLAACTAALLAHPRARAGASGEDAGWGLYHLSAAGVTTWHGFAAAIFAGAATRGWQVPALHAIPTREYPTPARRPHWSVLDTSRIQEAFGLSPSRWDAQLDAVLDERLLGRDPAGAPALDAISLIPEPR
jgi:dTDP-4-dehydrorhamnose reductase